MSRVTVEFIGPVRRPCRERVVTIELEGTYVVRQLLEHLGYAPDETTRLTVLVDGRRQAPDAPVPDGARLEILLLAGGG